MPEQELSDYLAYLLASANRQMKLGVTQSIADEQVTEEHWRILQAVSDEQGHAMGELAETVLLNHPALTKNVDKLVSRGLVQRAQDENDSRKVLVYISDRGLELVARLRRSVDAHHDVIEEALGLRNTKELKRLLGKLIRESQAD
ncbi:MarR family transcriptional regulator [Paraburkholderia acidicola]|uniref:MarR family transcriptional regulator n=1 Tax=Paraburkholderia acidicola TaxID=1912599 RepID=A0A2A4F341_9BURK|nr:MarR family transcriptional regulator [Paraburkholderia acidicola]PCE27505.1 MarR family transcriptional regulator [Paraburkholderia acidicola]